MKLSGILVLLFCLCVILCSGPASAAPNTGLWVGTVAIDKVSESQIAGVPAFTDPQPTGYPFTIRVIMHMNTAGTEIRLLKDVILMQQISTGDPVLVINDLRIPDFTCPDDSGEKICRRLGTTAYDFDGLTVPLTGSFATDGTLSANVVLTAENPTNPFMHKFHPDHDNLDGLGRSIVDATVDDRPDLTGKNIMEVYKVIRNMTFTFTLHDPLGDGTPEKDAPGWGTSLMGGTFTETLRGLHKNTIYVSGNFRMGKVSSLGELTQ